MKRELTIGLAWHSFRSGNLGVGALSVCNINLIDTEVQRSGASAKYIIFGNNGPCNYVPKKFEDKVEFIHCSAKNIAKNLREIKSKISSCDIIFDIGEGDSYADIYGIARLLKLTYTKNISLNQGIPTVICPQTIGPFNTKIGSAIAKKTLSKNGCEIITRDNLSTKELQSIGIKYNSESIDVAFTLDYDKKIYSHIKNKEKIIGINISGLLYHGGYTRKNQFKLTANYKELMHSLINHLLKSERTEIHLIPHVVSINNPIEDDYAVSVDIAKNFERVKISPRFTSPSEAKSYISNCDLFIGARMHSTIAAVSSGVACIPLAYSRKFAGLFQSINYNNVIDLRENSSEEIIKQIINASHSIDAISNNAIQSQKKAEEIIKVYKQKISDSIAKVI